MNRRHVCVQKKKLWELNSFSHVKTFFYSKQFAKLLTTWLKTIYRRSADKEKMALNWPATSTHIRKWVCGLTTLVLLKYAYNLVDKVLMKRIRFRQAYTSITRCWKFFLKTACLSSFLVWGKNGSWIFHWKIGHPRTLHMDLFVCCLNKFPANFQKKRPILSGWKISLSNFPTDPAGFSLLCNFSRGA